MKILETNKLKLTDITNSIKNWLYVTYRQTNQIFSAGSPFGHILSILNEYFQLLILYLEDIASESNISTATKKRNIIGWARLTGHNPTRSISANGTIKLRKKIDFNNEKSISTVIIPDKISLYCPNNTRRYFLNITNSSGSLRVNLNSREGVNLKIIQGEIESKTFTSNGNRLQSYSVLTKGSTDHNLVWVSVNGELFSNKDSLWDIAEGEKCCLIKTGISGGIDLYFGTGDFGYVPRQGDLIEIQYVKSDGYSGNIFTKNSVIFEFLDSGFDERGEIVDLNEVFDIEIEKPIFMGADDEEIELTKLIAPKTSRSYVLANPDNYINLLSKFGFSYIDASINDADGDFVADDNVINLTLIPDIKKRIDVETDYFSVPEDLFKLNEDNKNTIAKYINDTGQQIISTEINIVDPIIKKYAINIILRIYDTVDISILKNIILSKIAEYMLAVKRRDKLPKSDLIAIIENIKGVDSVNLSFVSRDNELKARPESTENLTLENSSLDEFGDIIIGKNEFPVIRGGWFDRYSNYYEDSIDDKTISSVNIIIKEVIKENLSIKLVNEKKSKIKN